MDDDEEPTRAIVEDEPSLSDLEATRGLPDPEPGPSRAALQAPVVGRYELLLELASGGMATVYVGRQHGAGGFERVVAIKRMHPHVSAVPELAASFMDEARIASLIRHPNVVNVHDVHEANGEHLLVMDYVEGVSLAQVVRAARKRKTKVPRPAALRVLIDALYGLHAAHEQTDLQGRPLGIVHRDATPHNILLGVDGSVRLTDFGIAKAAERSVHTATGLAKGKFRYMAPEQARGGALDRRVDVFAMGIVAWELLTGERLFAGESDGEVLLAISAGDYPPPSKFEPSVPAPLEQIVMRALSVDPNARWATAHGFAEALDQWARSAQELSSPSEVARLVDEFCGVEVRERRALLADVIAGRRPPLLPSGAPRTSGRGTGSTAAGPLTLDSVKILPAVSEADLQRLRWRRRALASAGVLGAVVVGVAIAWTMHARAKAAPVERAAASSPRASAAPAIAPTSPSSASKAAELVHVQLSADAPVAEIRAPSIENISFDKTGAEFDLPRSTVPVTIIVRFASGTEIHESLVPRENTAIRVLSAAPEPRAPEPRAPTRASHDVATPSGLEKNPY
jgi:eukaryotic-like serine/threonine-protein kinase